jgi:hypothetical protein
LSAAAAAAAVAIAGIAAAFTAVLAVMVMADEQAKELNSSMLEGAAMADFSLGNAATTARDLTEALSVGTDAAQEMAYKWRGQTKEFTAMLGQLNQAGLTYKEMTKGAKDHDEAVQMLAKHLDTAMVASKALGISTAETAEVMGQWESDFGMGLDEMKEQFAAVADAASSSNMQGKRFFSVVSQATAGMALYNNRMDEAAQLLAKTSKILGGTDASDFVKSLTKGFSDQSYVDRFKTIMIAGTEDVRKVMAIDADKMAKQFKTSFSGKEGVKGAFEDAMGKNFDMQVLSDPAKLTKMLAQMSDKDTRKLIQELKANGEDTAAMQISSMSKVAKGQEKGVVGMATAMEQLSMGGKLAVKLQGLGNQRLSEMNGIELAAYQQYTGQSTEQIEALRRIDENLMGEWEEVTAAAAAGGQLTAEQVQRLGVVIEDGKIYQADATGKSTGEIIESLDEYTSRWGDKNKEGLEGVSAMQDKASAFAQSSVENTTSILAWLQNQMTSMLTGIYDIMLQFYNAYMGISPEQVAMQREQLAENTRFIDQTASGLGDLKNELGNNERLLSTLDPKSADAEKLRVEIEGQKAEIAQGEEMLTSLREQRGAIERMETTQLKIAGFTGDGGVASKAALGGAGALDIASEVTGALGWDWYKGPIDLLRDIREEQGVGTVGQTTEIAGMLAGTVATMATPGAGFTPVGQAVGAGVNAGYTEGGKAIEENAGSVLGTLKEWDMALGRFLGVQEEPDTSVGEEQVALNEEALGVAAATQETNAELLVRKKKEMEGDKKWQSSKFKNQSYESELDALKAYEGWKLGTEKGLKGADLDAVMEEYSSGRWDKLKARGIEVPGAGGTTSPVKPTGPVPPVAPDFVMRPGQPAQRFNPSDTILGMKAGGPLAGGGGGGGTVNITINGGDQAKVYQTVKDALKNSGLR